MTLTVKFANKVWITSHLKQNEGSKYIVDVYKVLTKATVSIETNGQGIQKYIQW